MWPRNHFGRVDVVRVGAHAVELWRGGHALEQVARVPLPRRGSLYDADALVEPLRAIGACSIGASVIAVLETAYVPVLLADTGGVLTHAAQIDALLQHRFGLAYGSPEHDATSWRLRWTHRFGDRHALGYGLAPEVEAALRKGAAGAGLAFTAWVPALAWGLERLSGRRRAARCPWWVWTEQDRSLAVHTNRGQVDALDPALQGATSAAGVERVVAAAVARAELAGVGAASDAAASIGIGCWQASERPSGVSARTRVFTVAGDTSKASAGVGSAHALGGAAG